MNRARNFKNNNSSILWNKLQYGFALLMAFPIFLVLGQNASFIYFVLIMWNFAIPYGFFRANHWIKAIPIFLMLASIISVLDVNTIKTDKAFVVLPNYIYWQFLILLLIGSAKRLDYLVINKAIFIGTVSLAIFYQFFNWLELPFISRMTPNTYAFIAVCFTAPTVLYCKFKYGNWVSFFLLLLLVLILAIDGRRNGVVLASFTGLAALLLDKIDIKNLGFGLIISLAFFFSLSFDFVNKSLYNLNPRIHELIYDTESIQNEDRSYLTRRLMVEKGVLIFKDNPLTGVGLNNFVDYDVQFVGDFKGSEFVINKGKVNQTSAHNSYIAVLAEAGLLFVIPFGILLLYNLYFFVLNYNYRSPFQNGIYWGFVGAFFSMYFVSSILNVYTWYIIGLSTSMSIVNYKLNKS